MADVARSRRGAHEIGDAAECISAAGGRVRHANLIMAKDRNGLNNGVILVRVGQWAIKMFASALSLRDHEPGFELRCSEQTAMGMVVARVSILQPHSLLFMSVEGDEKVTQTATVE